MYIIDGTYFTAELYVPNTEELNSRTASELMQFVDRYVPSVLSDALGDTLFSDLDSHVENGVLANDAPQKWKDLVDGKVYTVAGVEKVWQGLRFQRGTFKGSLLANYVFCKWLEHKNSTLSGVGEVRPGAKNATPVNSTQRITRVWNEFVRIYQGGIYAQPRMYIYNSTPIVDYVGTGGSTSLLEFLTDHPADFPDFKGLVYEIQNSFGL